MVKLEDVAKIAGVSPTTVSRVINNHGYISQKTREKVFKVMKELHYEPNSIARSLTGKTSGLVGIIFSDTSNPFFGELVSKLESILFKNGFKSILCNSANSPEKERKYLQMLSANKVDGIISGTHNLNINEYDEITAPIVSFDRNLSKKIPVVSSDNFSGGVKATTYLVNSGAQNIHLFSSNLHSSNPTKDRVKGYTQVLNDYGLATHYHELGFEIEPEIKEMKIRNILNQEKIDGIFCTDDLTAIMVLNIAKNLNIKIPQDIKLVGYDGTDFVQTYFPGLPTIKQPLDEISQLLVKLLIDRIKNKNFKENIHYELPVKMIITG